MHQQTLYFPVSLSLIHICNYLLNVGPKADGTFPVMATRRLREMGAWLTANGEGIYDARPVSIKAPANVCLLYTSRCV